MYRTLLFILLFFAGLHGRAQIINTESAKMQMDSAGFMGNAHLNLGLTKSVEKIINKDIGLHFQYKKKKSLWILMANYNFLKGAEQKYVDNSFMHFRYAYKIKRRLNLEFFLQAESNPITQLKSRYTLGAGPRLKIFSNKLIHLHVASQVTMERKTESTVPVTRTNNLRSSSYVSFMITPNDRIQLSSTFFYQPLFKNLKDVQILNYALLKVQAAKHLSLSVRWYYFHDHFPVSQSLESLYTLGTGIDFDF